MEFENVSHGFYFRELAIILFLRRLVFVNVKIQNRESKVILDLFINFENYKVVLLWIFDYSEGHKTTKVFVISKDLDEHNMI